MGKGLRRFSSPGGSVPLRASCFSRPGGRFPPRLARPGGNPRLGFGVIAEDGISLMGLKSIGVIVAFTPALVLLALLARVALGLLLLSQMSTLPGGRRSCHDNQMEVQ